MNNNIIISNTHKRKKVPLYVFIYEDTSDRFRKFIALKYQKFEKGLLSYEVEQAITKHLSINNTMRHYTQTGKKENLSYEIKRTRDDIVDYLRDEFRYQNPRFIPEKHLDQALVNVRGITDQRTVKKWKQLLIDYGYVSKTGKAQCEIKVIE